MKAAVNIDAYVSLTPNGIHHSVYIGDESSDPVIESTHTWTDILREEIEMNTIPGAQLVPVTEESDALAEMFAMVETLRDLADRYEAQIMQLKVLKRDEWMKASKGGFDQSIKDQFIVSVDEYILENGDDA